MSLSTTPIQNQYVQQLADDLARNIEEQEKVRAQVEEAQKRLAVLTQEYIWLEAMRAQAAAAEATSAVAVPVTDDVPAAEEAPARTPVKAGRARRKAVKPQTVTVATDVPAPADAPAKQSDSAAAQPLESTPAEASKKGSVRKSTPKKTAKNEKSETTETTATSAKAVKAAKKLPGQRVTTTKTAPAERTKRGPSLADLIAPLLSADIPRSTKEVVAALQEHHPERSTSDQLVRNAINTLISRGRAQRHQQQNSVFYTGVAPQDEGVEAAAR